MRTRGEGVKCPNILRTSHLEAPHVFIPCYPQAEGAWPTPPPLPAGAVLPSLASATTASDLAKEAAAVIAQKKSKRKQQEAAMQQGQVRAISLILKGTN